MATEAEAYFSGLSDTANPQDRVLWETQIQYAERCRFDNPAAMDILRAEEVSTSGINEHREEVPDVGCDAERWIQMAINTEEKQYVPAYI